MIPIRTHKGIIICFEAEEEDRSMRQHFIKECGWSEKEYNRLKGSAWFCAKVSAWKGGEELAAEYLGACCYEEESDFWQEKGGYFDDMVQALLRDPKVRANFRPLGRLNVEQLSELVFINHEEECTLCWKERPIDSPIYELIGERYRSTRHLFNASHAGNFVGAPVFVCGGVEYNTQEVAEAMAAMEAK